jgi:hypothetical protein
MTRPSLIQNPLADSFVHVHVCMCMVLYISISNEYLPAPGMRRPLSARAMPASDLTNLRFYFFSESPVAEFTHGKIERMHI